ncbi:hypothetical protein IV38_GL000468 [Lactobacillus selangorensis]|uniref:SAM-dependent methyltransferase n=1 Tax=Lactobacillus selangorensis TaxID=81857 RepID=A0A0R2G050_9LACO|nr:class I SAM-dependent methyltransferase [Lactobacillus selangorensis]KRN29582.1 hypothetical protein IV38_GL000468 [Lactobacillus selangorensis]KRN33888.1 hypothetical protein IV40_GL000200 [Lactobacillus selangorensis]
MEKEQLAAYQAQTKSVTGRYFYAEVKAQLDHHMPAGKRVLDFGSGLGITADVLASDLAVTAYEPDADLRAHAVHQHDYQTIGGDWAAFKQWLTAQAPFDLILCHNVLEYVPNPSEVAAFLGTHLADGGRLSIIKQNRAGRVLNAAIGQDDVDQAQAVLDGSLADSPFFGTIHYYSNADLQVWLLGTNTKRLAKLGIRNFYGFHEQPYTDEALQLELAVCTEPAYRAVAYYNHIIVGK